LLLVQLSYDAILRALSGAAACTSDSFVMCCPHEAILALLEMNDTVAELGRLRAMLESALPHSRMLL
jgi:hypothetical protein